METLMGLSDQGDQVLKGVGESSRSDPSRLDPNHAKIEILVRVVALVLAGLFAWFFLESPVKVIVPIMLMMAIVLQLLISKAVPSSNRDVAYLGVDSAVTMLGIVTVPTLWIVGLVVGAAALIVSYSLTGSRWSQVFNWALILTSLAIPISQNEQSAFIAATFVVAILIIYQYRVGTNDRQLQSLHDDLSHGLTAGGIFVHLSSIQDGQAKSVIGPVENLVGWSEQEWTTKPQSSIIHPDDLAEFQIDPSLQSTGATFDRKARFRHKDGQWVWLHDVTRVVEANGQKYLRGFTRDVTELEKANRRIRDQAAHDELTGLFNRTSLTADVAGRLKRSEPFALVMLDLDRFKEINDTFGHEYGDQVLIETARRLQSISREQDTVARLGGDEFAIAIGSTSTEAEAKPSIDRILESLSKPINLADTSIHCHASIGYALSRRDQDLDVSNLLHWADVAMYEAKQGGTRSCSFSPEIEQKLITTRQRRSGVIKALDHGQLVLHFQPKVNLADNTIYGVEGLARWMHPTDGLLLPGEFIDAIAMSPQMAGFTDRMIGEGIKFASACNEQDTPVSVAVNIGARSLFDRDLAKRTAEQARDFHVDPAQLIFEITEQDIMDDLAATSSVLSQLSDLGIGLSVDDFGTGYSSLSRLIDLPVTEVKIDRRFVSQAPTDQPARVAAQSIIELAANLELDVVAEGVEEQAQVDLLMALGCQQAQGFLFARPASADQVLELLRSRRQLAVGSASLTN